MLKGNLLLLAVCAVLASVSVCLLSCLALKLGWAMYISFILLQYMCMCMLVITIACL